MADALVALDAPLTNAEASSTIQGGSEAPLSGPPPNSGIKFESMEGGGVLRTERAGPASITSTDDAFAGILKIHERDNQKIAPITERTVAPIEERTITPQPEGDHMALADLPPAPDGVTSVSPAIRVGLDPDATSHSDNHRSVVDAPEYSEDRVGPKQRTDWAKLKNHAKEFEKKAIAAERQLAQATQALQQMNANIEQFKTLPPNFIQEYNRLRQLETVMAPEVCSYVQQNFDVPIQQLDLRIERIIRQFNVDDNKIKQIRSPEGTVLGNDANGQPVLGYGGMFSKTGIEYLQKSVAMLEKGGYAQESFAIQDAIRENWKLNIAKQETIQKLKTDGEQMIQQQRNQVAENEKQMTASVLSVVNDLTKDLPYGHKIEITAAMNPQQRQWAEHANKIHEEVAASVADMLMPNQQANPPKAAHYIVRAALAPVMYREVAQLRNQVKELRDQLGKYQAAGNLQRAVRTDPIPPKPEEKKMFDDRPTADAMDSFFATITRK